MYQKSVGKQLKQTLTWKALRIIPTMETVIHGIRQDKIEAWHCVTDTNQSCLVTKHFLCLF